MSRLIKPVWDKVYGYGRSALNLQMTELSKAGKY